MLRTTKACIFGTSQLPKVLREWCALHFEMCFAPQLRELFEHLNWQNRSKPAVFLTLWLPNVLRATIACTFWTSLPTVLWEWCVLHILTSKCASRHNGVFFFHISTSKSAPRMVCSVRIIDLKMRLAPQERAFFHLSSHQMAPHLPL